MAEHEIDEATGLPVLPDNYYWQVEVVWERYQSVPTAFVTLRKRRSWVSIAEDSVLMGALHPDDIAEGRDTYTRRRDLVKIDPEKYSVCIARLAGKVLDKHAEQLIAEGYYARFRTEAKRLSGKYPPKSLNS